VDGGDDDVADGKGVRNMFDIVINGPLRKIKHTSQVSFPTNNQWLHKTRTTAQ